MIAIPPPTACPDLAIPMQVMRHLIEVESGGRPFAIGVVGGRLARQPENLDEALATVKMLESAGYDYSVGLTQVNRANLTRYGLDTPAKAFDPCLNTAAGAHILATCRVRSGNDWGKAFSCYYAGNPVAGFSDGYVRRIYDSIGRSMAMAGIHRNAAAIPVQPNRVPARAVRDLPPIGSDAYRIAIRSVALGMAANAATSRLAPSAMATATWAAQPAPATPRPSSTPPAVQAATTATGIFVPRVTLPSATAASDHDAKTTANSSAEASKTPHGDQPAHGADDAFVF